MVHIKCRLSDNTSALQTKTKKGGGGKSGSLWCKSGLVRLESGYDI